MHTFGCCLFLMLGMNSEICGNKMKIIVNFCNADRRQISLLILKGVIHLVRTQNFPTKVAFLTP